MPNEQNIKLGQEAIFSAICGIGGLIIGDVSLQTTTFATVSLGKLADEYKKCAKQFGLESKKKQAKIRTSFLQACSARFSGSAAEKELEYKLQIADEALGNALDNCFLTKAEIIQSAFSVQIDDNGEANANFVAFATDLLMTKLGEAEPNFFEPSLKKSEAYLYARDVVEFGFQEVVRNDDYFRQIEPQLLVSMAGALALIGHKQDKIHDDIGDIKHRLDLLIERNQQGNKQLNRIEKAISKIVKEPIDTSLNFDEFGLPEQIKSNLEKSLQRVGRNRNQPLYSYLDELFLQTERSEQGFKQPGISSAAEAAIFSRILGSDRGRFLDWDPRRLSVFYSGERARSLGELPYTKILSSLRRSKISLEIKEKSFSFSDRTREWVGVSRRGYNSLKVERSVFNDGQAIRMFDVDPDTGILKVQPALYSQQAQSNLIADFKSEAEGINNSRSLRELIALERPYTLPYLGDPRLANTVGISVLVFWNDELDNLRPLVQLRDAKSAAMDNRGVHCTGSRAARWPTAQQKFTIENFFDDEAYAAVKQDYDLNPDEVKLHPVGLLREHARIGKPQFFYFGYIRNNRSLESILEYRLDKQRREEQFLDVSERKYSKMTLDGMRDLIMTDVWEKRETFKLTMELSAMLYFLVEEYGKR